jgi:hypothetical protein
MPPLTEEEIKILREIISDRHFKARMDKRISRDVRTGWAVLAAFIAVLVVVLQALTLYHSWGH